MINLDVFTIIMIIFILLISYNIYSNSDFLQLKCIISDVDGKQYCVRERNKLNLAADKLALVNKNMKSLVNSLESEYPKDERTIRLKTKFNPQKIVETLPTSKFTAYSENKGEKLAFCLDKEKNGNSELIDLNTLTFVALHELSHVASISIGHTDEFWNNFKFILKQAEKINIYKPVDYKNNNKMYCGMEITSNPYFDL